MDVPGVESLLKGLLRGEFSELSISFNEHASSYLTVEKAIEYGDYERVQWISDGERAKAIELNSVWVLQWYPDTPIGSHTIGASTLTACLEFVATHWP
jgi:hypothetical protein